MLAAVAQHAPGLLPFVRMSYQQASALLLRRPDGAHEVLWSETGVRQGDTMGPFLFNLTYQPTLRAASEVSGGALVTACHNDTYLQGRPQDVAAGAALIMGRHPCQPQKTSVYCEDTDTAAHVAALLGAHVARDGIVVCGTPLGSNGFIAAHVSRRCAATRAQIAKLTALPLSPQPLHQVETALLKGLGDILDVTSLTDAQCLQALLPHRHGGMGLRRFTQPIADAVRLSSAALAHAALAEGTDRGLPFRGDAGDAMRHTLEELRPAVAKHPGLSECPAEPAEWAGLSGGAPGSRDAQPVVSNTRTEPDQQGAPA
eukprot:jgi/Ulvmu1/9926/UM058_0009.1